MSSPSMALLARGVRRKLGNPGESVEGLVIAHKADDQIKYALDVVPDVSLRTYEVEFTLREFTF